MTWKTWKLAGRPWQDLIFAIGEIVFLISLVPLLFTDTNVPAFTGIASAIMLYAFLAAHVSYSNWITVALTFVCATLWLLIGLGINFG